MHGFIFILLLQLATYSILTQLKCFQSSNIANDCLVSSTDPTYERGSGDIRLIPWTSLLSREKFISANHIAENTICTVQHRKFLNWLLQHDDTALFWHARKLVISFQLCIHEGQLHEGQLHEETVLFKESLPTF